MSTVVAVQSTVGWGRRGVVTGTNMFIRTLGSAVGIAVFGSIANGRLAHRRHTPLAIFHAVHGVFWALVVAAVLGIAGLVMFPRRVTLIPADGAASTSPSPRDRP